jgi:hypothetical protein
MGRRADAVAKIRTWRENPVAFVRENFGVEPDHWQAQALMSYANNQRTGVQSSKGPGKTAWLVWCILNFIVTRSHPKIVATSVSGKNLRDNLWTELAKWIDKSKFLSGCLVWTNQRVFYKKSPADWWCSARNWESATTKAQQVETLAGIHADYVMFVLDEAGGIPDAVAETADAGLAVGVETKMLIAGNPTHLSGPLYRAAKRDRHLWNLYHVNGDPDSPTRSSRISIKWAREMKEKWGENHPFYLVNVLGQFPPESVNSLLGPDEVRRSMDLNLREETYSFAQKRIGVDVARFGDDSTVLFPRQGLACFEPVIMRNARTNDIAARVMKAKADWGRDGRIPIEFVDDTGGWGAGVVDSLIQGGHNPIGINFASKPDDEKFKNKRVEMWWRMAQAVKRGMALPDVPELVGELCETLYTVHNGKLVLEDKAQIKEKLGRSPDLADALALTFAQEEMPQETSLIPEFQGGRMESEWDPFEDSRR